MALTKINDEDKLLARVAEGDQRAFAVLFKHYHKYVFAFGKKITYSPTLAEELVQDVFLKIWLNRHKLKSIENFGAYLNRLVRNQSLNVLRQLAMEANTNLTLTILATETDNSTIQQLDYKEMEDILKSAIETLSPQQKMVYILCHQQGMKYEDAAVEMNISPQTVHSYMKDALKKIRSHFKQYSVAYSVFFTFLFK